MPQNLLVRDVELHFQSITFNWETRLSFYYVLLIKAHTHTYVHDSARKKLMEEFYSKTRCNAYFALNQTQIREKEKLFLLIVHAGSKITSKWARVYVSILTKFFITVCKNVIKMCDFNFQFV